MKILMVNRALGTLFGGGESFDYNAARHLAARGHDVTLITGKPLFSEARITYPDVDIIYVPSLNLRRYAYTTERFNSKLSAAFYHLDNALFERAVFRWYSNLPAKVFDIVQCCSLFSLPEKLLIHFRQPVVSWLPGPPSGRVRSRLPRLIADPHFGLFTHGSPEWVLKELAFTRDREYEIITPGIDLSTIDAISVDRNTQRARLGVSGDALLGITIARLVPVKNHLLLLTALAKAKESGVIWHWAFIGGGPLEAELKRYTQALEIASQTHFLGQQAQHKVHPWLAVADLFALTSSYENFSIATLEAMAHRLPVVGTKVGYLKVLIADAQAGRTVSPTDSDALAQMLNELSDEVKRRGYGEAGRRFVERLDWPHIAQRLETFYTQVVQGRDQ